MKLKDAPPQPGAPKLSEKDLESVMHVSQAVFHSGKRNILAFSYKLCKETLLAKKHSPYADAAVISPTTGE